MGKRVHKHRHEVKLIPVCKSFDYIRSSVISRRSSVVKPKFVISNSQFVINFTLVELLVVIAIIGILASMLLPALSKAKNKAQSAACINKLKQLSLYLQFYVGDNNDYYMHYYDGNAPSAGTIWMRLVAEYDQKLNPRNLKATSINCNDWGKQEHCLICPTAALNPDTEIYLTSPDKAWYTAYAMNAKNNFIRNSIITSPSKKIMLVDSAHYPAYPVSSYVGTTNYSASQYWPHFRHDNLANTLNCDGHVDSIRQGLPDSTGLSATEWLLP